MPLDEAVCARSSHFTHCQFCLERIPTAAAVCKTCRTYQGWRWWVRLFALAMTPLSVVVSAGAIIYSNYEKARIPPGPILQLSASVSGGAVDLYIVNDGRGPAILQGANVVCLGKPFGKQFSNPIYAANGGTPLLPATSSELLRLNRMSGANVLARGKAMIEGGWRCVIEVTYKGPRERPLTAKAPIDRELAIALSGYDPAMPPAGALGPID